MTSKVPSNGTKRKNLVWALSFSNSFVLPIEEFSTIRLDIVSSVPAFAALKAFFGESVFSVPLCENLRDLCVEFGAHSI